MKTLRIEFNKFVLMMGIPAGIAIACAEKGHIFWACIFIAMVGMLGEKSGKYIERAGKT